MDKKKQIKIRYTTSGLANYFGDYIELNQKLRQRKHKKLREYIIGHELSHSQSFDLAHEFKVDYKIVPSLILFIIKNPETWIDFIPVQLKDDKIIYDLNLMILYGLLIIFTLGAFMTLFFVLKHLFFIKIPLF